VDDQASAGARLRQALLNLFAVLILLMMCVIALQVLCSLLGINPLVTFSDAVPLLGRAVSLNTLMELQWHLLVLIGLLPCALVWRMNAHVRVDFLYVRYAPRWQAATDLLGNVFLTIPFLFLCLPASWDFMLRAWRSAELSTSGGMTDRFLVKAVLPLGFAILGTVLLLECPGLLRRALNRKDGSDHDSGADTGSAHPEGR